MRRTAALLFESEAWSQVAIRLLYVEVWVVRVYVFVVGGVHKRPRVLIKLLLVLILFHFDETLLSLLDLVG